MTPDQLRTLSDPWNALLDRLPRSSFFNTPEWAAAWLESFGEPGTAKIACWWRADGQLGAIAHVVQLRERIHPRFPVSYRYLVPIGTGRAGADHAMYPAEADHIGDVRSWLEAVSKGRSFYLRNVAPWSPQELLPARARPLGGDVCMAAPLPFPISQSFQKKLRQYDRRLQREGIVVEAVGPDGMTAELLRDFDRLQSERRESVGEKSAVTDAHLSILRTLVSSGTQSVGLCAVTARRDDEVVGVLLGFVHHGRFEFFQIGWDPLLGHLSIGSVMICVGAQWAIQQGISEYDFLRGDDVYKRRFGAIPLSERNWLVPSGVAGRLIQLRDRAQRRTSRAKPRESVRA